MRKIYIFDIGLLVAAGAVAGVLVKEPIYPAQLLKAGFSQPEELTESLPGNATPCVCDPEEDVEAACDADQTIAGQGS